MGAICLIPSGLLPNAASALSLVSSRGMAIDFDSLRAAIRIWQQRITPFDGEHALDYPGVGKSASGTGIMPGACASAFSQ